jgi:pimeloyl-ACP methyl ester carboxylesterase
MNRVIGLLFSAALWLLTTSVQAQPFGSELLLGKETATAVVLAHGRGGGPDGQVVGPLRRTVNSELGFCTLSLQLPVLPSKDFRAYAATFPDAYKTIQSAIDYLTKEQGVKRVYLLGYSLGARMTSAFLAEQPHPAVVGYIGVGMLAGGGPPLDANHNIRRVRLPVLDAYADKTALDLSSAENRRSLVADGYQQVRIEGAEHSFRGFDSQVAQAVVAWLREQESKK